jgi:hypothetical protein
MIYDFDELPNDDRIPLNIFSIIVMFVPLIIIFPIILSFEIITLLFLAIRKIIH